MIGTNLLKIKQRIYDACIRSGRDPSAVGLIAVTKGRALSEIEQVLTAGIIDIGENKIQEALSKYQALSTVKFHMIGHLQTNKVKDAVRIFDLIHSVDSLRLAQEIDKQAAKINKIQDILVEVNTSGEKTKFGIVPDQVQALVQFCSGLKNIRLQGFMAMAPVVADPELARPYFKKLKEISNGFSARCLSMGMSDDFEVAIEEGATLVRIGRAIFEA